MSQPFVILAHTQSALVQAEAVAAQLSALGYGVDLQVVRPSHAARQALEKGLSACQRIVVLWSCEARGVPMLHAVAKRAKALGKLVLVRLDSVQPPARFGCAEMMPNGPAQGARWRRLIEASNQRRVVADALVRRAHSTSRGGGVLVAFLMATVAGTAAYFSDASFAARIDSWASDARARATVLVIEISS